MDTGNALKSLSWPHPSFLKMTTSNDECLVGPESFTQPVFSSCISAKPLSDKVAIVEHGVRILHSDCHRFIVPLVLPEYACCQPQTSSTLRCGYRCGAASGTRRVSSRILCLTSKRTSGVLAEQEVCVTREHIVWLLSSSILWSLLGFCYFEVIASMVIHR